MLQYCSMSFFFSLSIYYTMLDCSPCQTIYYKQPTVLETSEDRNPLYRQIETLLQSEDIRDEIQIKVACNQPTNYVSKSRETYHTENTESKETERRKLKIYLQNQKSRTLEHSWRLRGRRRSFLRREGKCTWMLLQEVNKVLNQWRCVIVFPPGNGHTDTGCTLQGKTAVYTPQQEHG